MKQQLSSRRRRLLVPLVPLKDTHSRHNSHKSPSLAEDAHGAAAHKLENHHLLPRPPRRRTNSYDFATVSSHRAAAAAAGCEPDELPPVRAAAEAPDRLAGAPPPLEGLAAPAAHVDGEGAGTPAPVALDLLHGPAEAHRGAAAHRLLVVRG